MPRIKTAALPWMMGLALIGATGAGAQDREREQRLADEIVDAIIDGEPVWLDADGTRFLGIYTESDADAPKGAVLVLHGRGFHPDWDEVAGPLRVALPERGWHSLSLQMPVLGKEAKYYDYVPIFPAAFPRIRVGIAYLREQGAERVVIAAHSCGVHMAMAFVDEFGDPSFDAFIGVGMGATDYGQKMRKPFPLADMKIPVLDLHGSDEFPGVLRMAPRRAAAIAQAGHPASRQRVIDGAEHYFRERDDDLVDAVDEWLDAWLALE